MRRGLNRPVELRVRNNVLRWKLFPDEKGIETCRTADLPPETSGGKLAWKLFPDEEGIETFLSTVARYSSVIALERLPR